MSKKPVSVVAAIFYRKNMNGDIELLLFRRAETQSGAGFWEFPGGKVEKSETEVEALHREILEELNVQIKVQDCLGENVHSYANKVIHLKAYFVQKVSLTDFVLLDHDAQEWHDSKSIKNIPIAAADLPLIDMAFNSLKKSVSR